MATVHLPRSLVTLFNDAPPRHVEIEAATLSDLVDALERRWPGMRDRLCEAGPRIREHVNVFVDGERQRDLAVALKPEAVVHIIPAVAGGSAPETGVTRTGVALDRAGMLVLRGDRSCRALPRSFEFGLPQTTTVERKGDPHNATPVVVRRSRRVWRETGLNAGFGARRSRPGRTRRASRASRRTRGRG